MTYTLSDRPLLDLKNHDAIQQGKLEIAIPTIEEDLETVSSLHQQLADIGTCRREFFLHELQDCDE